MFGEGHELLDQRVHTGLFEKQRHAHDDIAHGVDPNRHHFSGAPLGDELVRDVAHDAVQLVGRHEFVASLDEVRANLSHVLLVRGKVPLQVGVEVEHQELMRADEPRDEAAWRRDSYRQE